MQTGLGSADIRLDRGMIGDSQSYGQTRILAFRRFGRRVATTRFRATGEPSVAVGARHSFPFSTMAMADIVSTTADGPTTIDNAPFLTTKSLFAGFRQ